MATYPVNLSSKKPDWLKVRLPSHENYFYVSNLVKNRGLHTICQSARCPNVGECWAHKTATFLILGDICTRRCAFCAVQKGTPAPPPTDEARRVADSVTAMDLNYAVITSVTRDDLPDGGASAFVSVIKAVRARRPGIRIEVLVPDFQGNRAALETVLEAKPDVLNHNLEVPENIYPSIRRPRENYRRSLELLDKARGMGAVTKSGLMVGLGESWEDLLRTLRDLREAGCRMLTIGQYLQAARGNAPVDRYYTPAEFDRLRDQALALDFRAVASGPLVRSSYLAHRLFDDLREKNKTG